MASSHSAVIYFHGVGDPQRHVSLGTFLDHFQLYGHRQDKAREGHPGSFTYKTELFPGDEEVTHFVEFKRVITREGQDKTAGVIRVYEAYWVPESRSSFSVLFTIAWFASRLTSPMRFLFSRWRAFPAIRLLALFKLAETYSTRGHLEKLERYYRDFESWEGRRLHPKGRYKEFCEFVRQKSAPGDTEKLLVALGQWRVKARGLGFYHLLRLLLLLGAGIVVSVLSMALGWRAPAHLCLLPSSFRAVLATKALGASVSLGLALSILYLCVRTYIYDVISWTLESERKHEFASRERVVQYSQGLIRKIASHDGCERITIISHSLGSCIATEALLKEGVREGAILRSGGRSFLEKVVSVFTVGSPLDLIFFFFQADQTFSHRFNRIAEERRLSISLHPFRLGSAAGRTKIYNVWSRFDPISSSMQALRKRMSERSDAIVNLEVLPASSPWPIGSHTSYFADVNLMSAIYSSVMGTKIRVNMPAVTSFMQNHRVLRDHHFVQAAALPTIALFGVNAAASWVTVAAWALGTTLLIRHSARQLSADYQDRFGMFVHTTP